MVKIIEGNVNLANLHFTELFDLSDVEVTGYFNCGKNDLTSLAGCPKTVGDSLYCDNNRLTSLAGAPRTVLKNFYSHNNPLTSLTGCPEKVGGNFSCSDNRLTSLAGIPNIIGGDFYISKDLLIDKFSEEYIRSLSKIAGKVVYI